jgi:hypothetical protein
MFFLKKSPKMWPNQFLSQINTSLLHTAAKIGQLIWATSVIFEKVHKQAPNRRKFAQSGHPVPRNGCRILRDGNLMKRLQDENRKVGFSCLGFRIV